MPRLREIKMQHGYHTASVFLQQPMAERLLKKPSINVLDFGCGDCCFTLGLAHALGRTGNARQIRIVGINADIDNGGATGTQFKVNDTQVVVLLAEPLQLTSSMQTLFFRSVLAMPDFDLVSIFNPSPPDRIMQLILSAHRQLTGLSIPIPGLPIKEAYTPEEIRKILISELQKLGVSPSLLKELDVDGVINLTKKEFFENSISEVVPYLLAQDGILFIASDRLLPTEVKLELLRRHGYEVRFQAENCPEGIFAPIQITEYNADLIGAVLNRS